MYKINKKTTFSILFFISSIVAYLLLHTPKKDTVVILASKIPLELDSTKTISYNDIQLIDNLFYKLFRRNSSLDIEGELAQSWKIDKKNKLLIININTDKGFSDNTRVTADSIAKSINRAIDSKSVSGFFFRNIKSAKTSGDNIVVIKFEGWEGSVYQQLTSPFMAIYKNGNPPTNNRPDTWITRLPYKIVIWEKERLQLEMINSIFKRIDVVTNEFSPNVKSIVDVVLSRDNTINQDQIVQELEQQKDVFNKYRFDSFNSKLLFLNSRIPIPVRRCVQSVLWNSNYRQQAFGTHINQSIFPPGTIARKEWPSPAKNKTIRQNLKLEVMVRKNNIAEINLTNALIQILNQCITEPVANVVDDKTYYQKLLNQNFDIVSGTISVLYNDPLFILAFFHPLSKFNITNAPPKLGAAIDAVTSSTSQAELIKNAERAQELIFKEALVIPLANLPTTSYIRKPLTLRTTVMFDLINWEDLNAK